MFDCGHVHTSEMGFGKIDLNIIRYPFSGNKQPVGAITENKAYKCNNGVWFDWSFIFHHINKNNLKKIKDSCFGYGNFIFLLVIFLSTRSFPQFFLIIDVVVSSNKVL